MKLRGKYNRFYQISFQYYILVMISFPVTDVSKIISFCIFTKFIYKMLSCIQNQAPFP